MTKNNRKSKGNRFQFEIMESFALTKFDLMGSNCKYKKMLGALSIQSKISKSLETGEKVRKFTWKDF